MTPLEFAQALADDLKSLTPPYVSPGPIPPGSLPLPVYAQLGDIIVDCEGTTVSIMNKTEQEMVAGGSECGIIEMADIIVIAARECADVANDDGTTDHDAMATVAAGMDADGVVLEDWADKLMAESWWRLGRPTITYTIQGAIAFVTLAITLPIP